MKRRSNELRDVGLGRSLLRDWRLYAMLMVPVTVVFIFKYLPIFQLAIAFEDYNFVDGVFGSKWVDFKWFEKFFSYRKFGTIVTNTLKVSFASLLFGFPAPIIFALMLNELGNQKYKKFIQSVSYVPHFISTVIVIGMMNQLLSPTTGIVNQIIVALGGKKIMFQSEPQYFVPMYVVSGIWSTLGYSAILYISALTNINQELYEAAEIDGAGRFRKIWHVTLPGILPTIMILFLMKVGSLLSVGFEKAYLMQNDLNVSASEIIGTFVYKQGMLQLNYSYSSAVDLLQGVLNLTLVTIFNMASKKIADVSLW